jgi:hypothetical protein
VGVKASEYKTGLGVSGKMVRVVFATEIDNEKEPLPAGGFPCGFSQRSSVFEGVNGLGQESKSEQKTKSNEQSNIEFILLFSFLIPNSSLLIPHSSFLIVQL